MTEGVKYVCGYQVPFVVLRHTCEWMASEHFPSAHHHHRSMIFTQLFPTFQTTYSKESHDEPFYRHQADLIRKFLCSFREKFPANHKVSKILQDLDALRSPNDDPRNDDHLWALCNFSLRHDPQDKQRNVFQITVKLHLHEHAPWMLPDKKQHMYNHQPTRGRGLHGGVQNMPPRGWRGGVTNNTTANATTTHNKQGVPHDVVLDGDFGTQSCNTSMSWGESSWGEGSWGEGSWADDADELEKSLPSLPDKQDPQISSPQQGDDHHRRKRGGKREQRRKKALQKYQQDGPTTLK
jgi:hypothetical protein